MSRRYWYRPEVGPQPPFVLVSTNIGLGCGNKLDYAMFKDPDGKLWNCGIEPILRTIDLLQEPGRTAMLASVEDHYGLPLGAMMGPEADSAQEGGGA